MAKARGGVALPTCPPRIHTRCVGCLPQLSDMMPATRAICGKNPRFEGKLASPCPGVPARQERAGRCNDHEPIPAWTNGRHRFRTRASPLQFQRSATAAVSRWFSANLRRTRRSIAPLPEAGASFVAACPLLPSSHNNCCDIYASTPVGHSASGRATRACGANHMAKSNLRPSRSSPTGVRKNG